MLKRPMPRLEDFLEALAGEGVEMLRSSESPPPQHLVSGLSSLHPVPHLESTTCWCEPELVFLDDETGARTFRHRGVH